MRLLHKFLMRSALGLSLIFTAGTAEKLSAQETSSDYGEWGVDLSAIDDSVDPGDDFYRYVSGNWLARSQVPEGYPRWSSFEIVGSKAETQVAQILSDLGAASHPAGSPEQQVADFYRSYLDVERRNRMGIEPLRDLIDSVMAISDRQALSRLMAQPELTGPIAFGVLADPGNPERALLHTRQGGLTMPDPVYYLGQGEEAAASRAAFVDYAEKVLARAGFEDAAARAQMLLELETEIARRQWTAEESRDAVKMYHLMSKEELAAFAPGVDWDVMFAAMGAGNVAELNVNQDTAIRDLAALVEETPLQSWRTYLVFHLLDDFAELLDDDLNQANFAFHGTALAGITAQRPLEARALVMTNAMLGEPIGKIYAERYFSPEYKQTIQTMIGYLTDEYRSRFESNPWMDDATRTEALAKLDQIVPHIGFPDRYHDYSSVRIAPDDLVGNARRLEAWVRDDAMARMEEPTRKWEWPFLVHEINAAYLPSTNSITFPAGILQPPFFHPDGDIAVNFGSIGAVIGHELGHAFDDQGKNYDGTGKIRNWWTEQSENRFRQRTERLVSQFNEYSPIEGANVNGALTLGENIGDLGGLTVGYAAYRRYVEDKQGGEAPVIDGFTGDQRFFLSWGQLWRMLSTDAETRRRLAVDVHSPGEFRANGSVRNVDGWYEAFDVGPDDDLYLPPEKRVKIW